MKNKEREMHSKKQCRAATAAKAQRAESRKGKRLLFIIFFIFIFIAPDNQFTAAFKVCS